MTFNYNQKREDQGREGGYGTQQLTKMGHRCWAQIQGRAGIMGL